MKKNLIKINNETENSIEQLLILNQKTLDAMNNASNVSEITNITKAFKKSNNKGILQMDKFTKTYMRIITEMNNNHIIKESGIDAWSEAADKITLALQSDNEDIADEFLQEMGMDEDLFELKETFVNDDGNEWDEDSIDEPEVLWDIIINKFSNDDIIKLAKKYQLI